MIELILTILFVLALIVIGFFLAIFLLGQVALLLGIRVLKKVLEEEEN